MENPDKGNTVVSSGGVRKIRWAINNKGKSGGIRVIYYWKEKSDEIWLPSMQRMKKTLYQPISLNK
jgi:mRNA-degrading endonuclease RelE of RelBE toxin-antitoxin system